jgi:hypothetical protein
MDNHYHLLIETPEPNLGRGMQWLNTSYCVWFNRRHDRVGHLLQNRFKSIVVDPASWGLELSRYIHLNTVRVGRFGLDKEARRDDRTGMGAKPKSDDVRARIQKLREYQWSSYRAYIGLTKRPPWLEREAILQLGGNRKRETPGYYRRYVEEAVREGLAVGPWEQMRDRTVLGGQQFARRLAKGWKIGTSKNGAERRMGAPSVEEVIAAVEAVKGEKWNDFRDRHGDWGRDLVFFLGRKGWAMRLKELAAAAGGMDEIAVSMAARRVPMKTKSNPCLAKALEACKQKFNLFNV